MFAHCRIIANLSSLILRPGVRLPYYHNGYTFIVGSYTPCLPLFQALGLGYDVTSMTIANLLKKGHGVRMPC